MLDGAPEEDSRGLQKTYEDDEFRSKVRVRPPDMLDGAAQRDRLPRFGAHYLEELLMTIEPWLIAECNPTSAQQPAATAPSLTPRLDRARERLQPLKDRLAVALAAIPAEIKKDGLMLQEVWPLCLGRQRSKPTAFSVADAPRALGWVRVRHYSDGPAGSPTLWYPPEVAKDLEVRK